MNPFKVQGYCPMGCGQTLFLGNDGYITCSYLRCPQPDAVSTILENSEHEHIVTTTENDFTIKHPLRERLGDALLNCRLRQLLVSFDGPPVKPGIYRVTGLDHPSLDKWLWSPWTLLPPATRERANDQR